MDGFGAWALEGPPPSAALLPGYHPRPGARHPRTKTVAKFRVLPPEDGRPWLVVRPDPDGSVALRPGSFMECPSKEEADMLASSIRSARRAKALENELAETRTRLQEWIDRC